MLQHFARAGVRHLGVEPSANVAEGARRRAINTICASSTRSRPSARRRARPGGRILGGERDVPHAVHALGAARRPGRAQADGACSSSRSRTSATSSRRPPTTRSTTSTRSTSRCTRSATCSAHGMEIIDAAPQAVHGGSMRYVVAAGPRPSRPRRRGAAPARRRLGLRAAATYVQLRQTSNGRATACAPAPGHQGRRASASSRTAALRRAPPSPTTAASARTSSSSSATPRR